MNKENVKKIKANVKNGKEKKMKKKKDQISITNHTEGTKMEYMHSLNTSCLVNPRCRARMKNGDSVCAQCFAAAHLKHYTTCNPPFERNGEILSERILPTSELRRVNDVIFRLEAFGDIINDIHFINYLNFCKKNPRTKFALWTKNLDIVEDVLVKMGYKKPKNLTIVYSSPLLNTPAEIPASLIPYIDHVFTVYSKEYAEEHGVKINCGSRHCIDCQICYRKNKCFYINELLKKDQKKKKKKA